MLEPDFSTDATSIFKGFLKRNAGPWFSGHFLVLISIVNVSLIVQGTDCMKTYWYNYLKVGGCKQNNNTYAWFSHAS